MATRPRAAAPLLLSLLAAALAVKNGIAYLTFAGLVETPGTGSGAVVTLTRDRILVDGLGREPDRDVPLRRSPD